MSSFRSALFVAIALIVCAVPTAASARTSEQQVSDSLTKVLTSELAPPGVIVTMHRHGKTTTLSGGRSQIGKVAKPRITDHMRLASVTKAFTGAVVLRLVDQEAVALEDTIGQYLPSMPPAWHAVT